MYAGTATILSSEGITLSFTIGSCQESAVEIKPKPNLKPFVMS